jgi:ubiquitin carboxyl-terminal hydrolase 14
MATSFPLCVTWGKEKIELSIDPTVMGVKGLKSELQEHCQVPAARQKILAKSKGLWKGVLKDDIDLASIDWPAALAKSNPLQLLLMGSRADQVVSEPTVKTVFLEDLPEELKAQVAEPAGLVNLGNTCYMNSVVQALRGVPELRSGLQRYRPTNPSPSSLLVHALSQTMDMLDAQTTAVQPMQLVGAVKMAFPQFAQRTPDGRPMQQDAEEFYSGLLTMVAQEARDGPILRAALPHVSEFGTKVSNVADALFGMEMQETFTCDEEPHEPVITSTAWHRKLTCNISAEANHIAEGINLALRGKIEKHSELLQRNALWTREDRIAKLPIILTVQFGRFYWKTTPDSQDHTGVKCKIMKPMTFNDTLDIYDFCSADIQAILKNSRAQALKAEEEIISKKLKGEDMDTTGNNDDGKPAAAEEEEKQPDTSTMEVDGAGGGDEEEEDDPEALQAALAMSLESSTLGPGIPANFQGHYELFAVVTHKGRDADGGHYMSFVKSAHQKGGADGNTNNKIADSDNVNEDWFVFDDDSVSPCKTEDVLKLKGGGDWHMSYLNFYRIKK